MPAHCPALLVLFFYQNQSGRLAGDKASVFHSACQGNDPQYFLSSDVLPTGSLCRYVCLIYVCFRGLCMCVRLSVCPSVFSSFSWVTSRQSNVLLELEVDTRPNSPSITVLWYTRIPSGGQFNQPRELWDGKTMAQWPGWCVDIYKSISSLVWGVTRGPTAHFSSVGGARLGPMYSFMTVLLSHTPKAT